MKKARKKQGESVKRITSEKPISLKGASFSDVIKALLETKPPKKKKTR